MNLSSGNSKYSHAIFITVRQDFPIQNNANVGSNAFTGTVEVESIFHGKAFVPGNLFFPIVCYSKCSTLNLCDFHN